MGLLDVENECRRCENKLKRSRRLKVSEYSIRTLGHKKPMDLELYKATVKGDVIEFKDAMALISTDQEELTRLAIFEQVSPLENTFIHVAASFGHDGLVEYIANQSPSVLTSRNSKGDTALHVAVRAGHFDTVRVLVGFGEKNGIGCSSINAGNDQGLLLRLKNKEGNTALHEAVLMDNHEDLIVFLTRKDEEVSYYVNNEGKSPFYLAVEANKEAIVEYMLEIFVRKGYSHERFTGKSPVHAAIVGENSCLLHIVLDKMPTLVQLRDEEGGTPLHCAASIGSFQAVKYLLGTFRESVLERDGNGFLPVHVASRKGRVSIVEWLLNKCPDWRELLTRQGENILHVAAKSGKYYMVKRILETPEHAELLNEKDEWGNTPLHLATIHWHPKVVSCLTWDKRVNPKLVNNHGMTALDVAEAYMETTASFRKRLTLVALKSAGAPQSKCLNTPKVNAESSQQHESLNMDKYKDLNTPKVNAESSLQHESPNYKDRVNTLLLVSTLVATVTFAAGFTMPGGYNNSAPDQGMATMLHKPMFQMFVICDTIAMHSSIIVAVSLIWAQLGDVNLVLNSLRLAMPLLGTALGMMSLAFLAGVYLVVSKLRWLAHVILIMGIIFLATLSVLFIPLFFPTTSSRRFIRCFSYYIFYLMMLASRSYADDEDEEFG